MRVRRGIEGERDAAFYIDSYFKDSENHAVLHDLRLDVEGEVAQIDHLFFNRVLHFILIETKCFNGNVTINEQGEFTVTYANGRAYGLASPLEQSKRHARILAKVLDNLEITGRMGMKPTFHHLVLLHPKAIIERPDKKAFDASSVVKADALPSWHQKWIDTTFGVTDTFAGLLSVRSSDTIKEWAEKLARQHRPVNPLSLPDFMAPQPSQAAMAVREPEPRLVPSPMAAMPGAASPSATPDEALKKKLICVTCHAKIPYNVGLFCWNNERRFGGFQYCREHQQGL
ncbi:MAG: NERD domain-containing protein [Proteobacteria bacterium]|uniref:nuclease-related domain-containing protein n=1 Tax=Aquabacterium sp. TaxID=1872578 RepID=UPI0035C73D36|nr:NERD domain-containing protein [Pseudomonadota bacterium]